MIERRFERIVAGVLECEVDRSTATDGEWGRPEAAPPQVQ